MGLRNLARRFENALSEGHRRFCRVANVSILARRTERTLIADQLATLRVNLHHYAVTSALR